MDTRLFVGNLSYAASDSDLLDLFSPHGVVVDVKIINDRETGRPRGFAFVTMSTREGAIGAMEALNGTEFQGRPLKINEARPRTERPAQFSRTPSYAMR